MLEFEDVGQLIITRNEHCYDDGNLFMGPSGAERASQVSREELARTRQQKGRAPSGIVRQNANLYFLIVLPAPGLQVSFSIDQSLGVGASPKLALSCSSL